MKTAILMASGMGTRMRPLTLTTPKPLVCVNGKPMIETIIEGFQSSNIDRIVVVVGYLSNQFQYLTEKYQNIILMQNDVYETVNNISSIYAARTYLEEGDCYICEADLFVADKSVLSTPLSCSCYFGKMVNGYSADWVFDQDAEGYITRVGKCGTDCFNMTGIAFFLEDDAKRLKVAIEQEYGKAGYESLFWDDVVNRHISDFKLKVHPIEQMQIIEIDTVGELREVEDSFRKE